jgi:hypothetical protein
MIFGIVHPTRSFTLLWIENKGIIAFRYDNDSCNLVP